MAELKRIENFEDHSLSPEMKEEIQRQKEQIKIVQLSNKRVRQISNLEKVSIFLVLLVFVALAVATVRISTTVTKVTEDVTTVQQKVEADKADIEKLEQEKSELSRAERIKSIAEKAGLSAKDSNIRNVTK